MSEFEGSPIIKQEADATSIQGVPVNPSAPSADDTLVFESAVAPVGEWQPEAGGGGGGGGDVTGPASAVADNLVSFQGTTGKQVKDSGFAPSDFAPASAALPDPSGEAGALLRVNQAANAYGFEGTCMVGSGAPADADPALVVPEGQLYIDDETDTVYKYINAAWALLVPSVSGGDTTGLTIVSELQYDDQTPPDEEFQFSVDNVDASDVSHILVLTGADYDPSGYLPAGSGSTCSFGLIVVGSKLRVFDPLFPQVSTTYLVTAVDEGSLPVIDYTVTVVTNENDASSVPLQFAIGTTYSMTVIPQVTNAVTSPAAAANLAFATFTGSTGKVIASIGLLNAVIGVNASGTIEVVDYEQLSGASFELHGITYTEGVEWVASDDNETTAASIGDAVLSDTDVTSAVDGAIVTFLAAQRGNFGNAYTLTSSDGTNLPVSGSGFLEGGTDNQVAATANTKIVAPVLEAGNGANYSGLLAGITNITIVDGIITAVS